MTDIFISYAREDKDFVARLSHALKQGDREPWFDLKDILPSAEWRQEIFAAIENAQAFVHVITPHSSISEGCAEELSHALLCNKRVIPILHKEVDERNLPDALKTKQWVSILESDDFDAAVGTLVKAVDTNIEWVRFHTRLLTRAKEWERHNRDFSYALRGTDLRKAEDALTANNPFEPRLLPLQIDYILASRKTANRRVSFGIASAAVAVVGIVVLGALFVIKRQESALNLAANFREMGVSEIQSNNPLAAEVFFSRALSISDNVGARERLIEARAQSPRLLWINAPVNASTSLLAMSADGVLFAEVSPAQLSIWNVPERRQVRTYQMRGDPNEKHVAAFGPLHHLLAIATGNTVDIWDLRSPSENPIQSIVTLSDVSSLNITSDSSFLITGEGNGRVISWSIAKGDHSSPARTFLGHSDRITSVVASNDGRTLISGSWDETAKAWDLVTGGIRNTFAGHDDALLCVAISPSGELVASAGWDDTIWIWDRHTGKGIRALTGHRGSILSLAFSPDGRWLVSGSEDRTVRLWDVEKGRHVLTFPGHAGDVTSVAFLDSRGTEELVTGDSTGVVRLWDISRIGQRRELTTLRGHDAGVTMISFDSAAPLLASSSSDKSARVWNLQTGRLLDKFISQNGNVSAVAFSPDGKDIALASKTASVIMWELATGQKHVLADSDPAEQVRHVAFSPDGKFLIGGSEDGRIRVWNLSTGDLERSFVAHTAKIQGFAFSPDGTLLASASEDSTIKLWDVTNWSLRGTLIGHRSGVYEIAFSPDGKVLLSGSDDKTARLWSIASAKELTKPIEHASPVWAVDFGPDGKLFATGSEDSTVVGINNRASRPFYISCV